MIAHPRADPAVCVHAPAGGTRPRAGWAPACMWMVASIPHHPRTHAAVWAHPSRLMDASFRCDGRISPVGSMHAPAGWVHPSMGIRASLSWDRCTDIVGARVDVVGGHGDALGGRALPWASMHPSRGVDTPPNGVDAPTYDVDAPPTDVDTPIPLGRAPSLHVDAPIPWGESTHPAGARILPPTSGAPM